MVIFFENEYKNLKLRDAVYYVLCRFFIIVIIAHLATMFERDRSKKIVNFPRIKKHFETLRPQTCNPLSYLSKIRSICI